ncbi:hypothetical protein BW687_021765 [Pseudomonas graminis]|uniref:hypothetical protein n=1 Tax=Pseudomonas graminis TaxID=158627 RepID=UPI00234A5720|nr:hypothetical protein [Pseudomonas graminis]MDC6382798.1 hypothetical protein [Pseudomonas graminis]
MNLENLPAQLIGLFAGWLFTIYLQHNANRRTEALKRKDKIIDRLDGLVSWVESETKKDNYNPDRAEEAYTGLLLELDLRVAQFNAHVRSVIVTSEMVGALRDVDFFDVAGKVELSYRVRRFASQIVERIELGCDDLYFSRSFLHRVNNFFYELSGLAAGLNILASLLLIAWLVIAALRS